MAPHPRSPGAAGPAHGGRCRSPHLALVSVDVGDALGGEGERGRETSPHGEGREEYKDGVAEGGREGGVKEGSLVVRTLRLLHLLYRLELAYSGSLGCV